jgi:uncharacterized protein YneF (UPF0154 family)
MPLKEILNAYKQGRQFKNAVKGGDGDGGQPSVEMQQAILKNRLDEFWRFTDKILIVIFIVLIAFVIFLGILIWRFYTQPAAVAALVAGQSGGIYFAIDQMHKLFKESITSRMLLTMLNTASDTGEKSKIIDAVVLFLNNKNP